MLVFMRAIGPDGSVERGEVVEFSRDASRLVIVQGESGHRYEVDYRQAPRDVRRGDRGEVMVYSCQQLVRQLPPYLGQRVLAAPYPAEDVAIPTGDRRGAARLVLAHALEGGTIRGGPRVGIEVQEFAAVEAAEGAVAATEREFGGTAEDLLGVSHDGSPVRARFRD
jgi:hypothetical protein